MKRLLLLFILSACACQTRSARFSKEEGNFAEPDGLKRYQFDGFDIIIKEDMLE